MNLKEFNNREIEILKQIPKSERPEFIEKHGQRVRDLLEDEEWHSNLEIIEALTEGYKGI